MALTKQDIHAAADAIAATGDTPTLAKVRTALGGGSFTTISEAMTEWKAAHAQQKSVSTIREPAPEVVTEMLGGMAADLWSVAIEKANARLQEERDALEEARKKMEATLIETKELADQLSTELEAEQTKAAELEKAVAAAAAEAEIQGSVVHDLGGKLAVQTDAAHTASAALDETRKRVDQLTDLLAAERDARSTADALASEKREAVAKLEAELKASTDKLTETAARLADSEKQALSSRKEAENARMAEQKCQSHLESTARDITRLEGSLKDAKKEAADAVKDAAALAKDVAVLSSKLEAVQAAKADKK